MCRHLIKILFHFRYNYPLAENESKNKEEDRQCLEVIEDKINNPGEWPVAGVIIEPIQSEGGDREASPEFFQGLQQICKNNGVGLIIDEVQTGGGCTGKWWCFEHFDLPEPPDVVVFSKKMQFGGYYHGLHLRAPQSYRIFNTWMGDSARLLLLEAVIVEVERCKLLEQVVKSGVVLEQGLNDLCCEFPHLVNSPRGRGTFRAFTVASDETRNKLLYELKQLGILVGVCGPDSVRLRPALTFNEKHAEIFLDRLREALKTL